MCGTTAQGENPPPPYTLFSADIIQAGSPHGYFLGQMTYLEFQPQNITFIPEHIFLSNIEKKTKGEKSHMRNGTQKMHPASSKYTLIKKSMVLYFFFQI